MPTTGAPEHFDAVVVGSGFGGSVTAARLAEAERRVCVLERGKAYPPGSFPRSPWGLKNNFWDPSEQLYGMFDVWSFDGLEALISSGLGGGSLIYANVLIRKDERWFVQEDNAPGGERWPLTRADLEPHYDEAERALGAQRYPMDHEPYASTPKTVAFREAARALGQDWFLPNLAVTFANAGRDPAPGEPIVESRPNYHGRARETCRLVGECDVGCNFGAKNSLDYTYLTAAWHAGADIRTLSEVRSFEPRDGGGWIVDYVHHGPDDEERPPAPVRMTADDLILSAGTLGTTYLLLKNRAALPGLSAALGRGFTGNGDLLTFAMRCAQDGLDGTRVPRVVDPARGPVITSAIRVGDALDGDGSEGRGFYLEDAGYPEFASWMLQLLDSPRDLLTAVPVLSRLVRRWAEHERETNLSDEVSDLFGDCGLSNGLLPLLGMGRDVPDGRMSLKDGRLEVDWRKHGASEEYFERVRHLSHQIADQLGGEFLDNPIWHLNRVITVHALGGCRMGRDDSEGVVDSYGNVFNLPGLHVADGSVMPGPVGPNPSLTIAALAERFTHAMIDGAPSAPQAAPTRAATTPEGSPPVTGAQPGSEPASLEFTEEMKGFVSLNGESDYDRGFRAGRESKTSLMFHLTITATDVDRFIDDAAHEGVAHGYVHFDVLGGRLPVERGVFNLFVDQHGERARKRMFYRLYFSDQAGHPLTLVGHKIVQDDPGLDVWSDTSTLFPRVFAGHVDPDGDERARVVATGILHIHLLVFAKQLTTFRVHPATRVDALARFGKLFAGELWEAYRPRIGS